MAFLYKKKIMPEKVLGVYILQMTRILFPGRTDPAPKIFAIEGNLTPPN